MDSEDAMIHLATVILWLALGVLILGGVVWLALYAIKQFVPLPSNIEMAIWIAFLILVLIYTLYAIEGGGVPSFR